MCMCVHVMFMYKYLFCTHSECSLQKYFCHDPDLLQFERIPLGWAPRDISGFCMKMWVIGNLSFFRLGGRRWLRDWSESDLAQQLNWKSNRPESEWSWVQFPAGLRWSFFLLSSRPSLSSFYFQIYIYIYLFIYLFIFIYIYISFIYISIYIYVYIHLMYIYIYIHLV